MTDAAFAEQNRFDSTVSHAIETSKDLRGESDERRDTKEGSA
jgi:hypothetical protein